MEANSGSPFFHIESSCYEWCGDIAETRYRRIWITEPLCPKKKWHQSHFVPLSTQSKGSIITLPSGGWEVAMQHFLPRRKAVPWHHLFVSLVVLESSCSALIFSFPIHKKDEQNFKSRSGMSISNKQRRFCCCLILLFCPVVRA